MKKSKNLCLKAWIQLCNDQKRLLFSVKHITQGKTVFLGKGKSHNGYFRSKANRTEMRFTVAWLMQRRIAKIQNVEHGRDL